MAYLARIFYWADSDFSLWRVRRLSLCSYIQFYAPSVFEAIVMTKKASQSKSSEQANADEHEEFLSSV